MNQDLTNLKGIKEFGKRMFTLGASAEVMQGKYTPEQIDAAIISSCVAYKLDPVFIRKIIECESNNNPVAYDINDDGSVDRGLAQINDKFHAQVADEMAFDAIAAVEFLCSNVAAGNLSWWESSKTCWGAFQPK